jgi:DNA-binding MarR family transcriptional regulator/GNAT superfamily N-acetyltransferase
MGTASIEKKSGAEHLAIDRRLIDSVREFNRFYTRQLGLLDSGYLRSKWTLTEVRVLYEIVRRRHVTASEIAEELRLDVAYLSRILAKFQKQRLLKRVVSTTDARERHLTLTTKGIAAFKPLDRSATDQMADMLAPLSMPERNALVLAMRQLEQLLARPSGTANVYSLRSLRIGDIGWVTHRQALLYAQEYGWDIRYEALVAEILVGFLKDFDQVKAAAWIAERAGAVVGSVFLMPATVSVARLRLLYVEPSVRGMGLGRRLVDECIAGARERGYQTLTLWTNSVLVSARRIYEAAGFRLCTEERHHSFGKNLVGQTWELSLSQT